MANYNTPSKPFQKGNPGKPIGAISAKTKVVQALGLHMNESKAYMEGIGYERFINEMNDLDGRDYVSAYLAFLEYVKPKLARKEIVSDAPKQVINIFGKKILDSQNPNKSNVQNDGCVDITDIEIIK